MTTLAAAESLPPGADLELRVTVRNTGPRAGREIVQAYVAGPATGGSRPVRVLGAFSPVRAEPGEAVTVTLTVPARIFASYDELAGRWAWSPGQFTVSAGRSSRDLRLSASVLSG